MSHQETKGIERIRRKTHIWVISKRFCCLWNFVESFLFHGIVVYQVVFFFFSKCFNVFGAKLCPSCLWVAWSYYNPHHTLITSFDITKLSNTPQEKKKKKIQSFAAFLNFFLTLHWPIATSLPQINFVTLTPIWLFYAYIKF